MQYHRAGDSPYHRRQNQKGLLALLTSQRPKSPSRGSKTELSEQFEFENHNGGKDLLFLACYFIFIQCSVASTKASWRLCGRWSSCEPSSGSQGQELEQAPPWRNTFYEEPPMTCIPAQASLWSHATHTDPSPGHLFTHECAHNCARRETDKRRGSRFLQLGSLLDITCVTVKSPHLCSYSQP